MAKRSQPDSADSSEGLVPREPDSDKGKVARAQYLAFARAVLRENFADYGALFQKYASDQADGLPAAQELDQTVARLALQSGHAPRQVIQLIAQGPFVQFETRSHSEADRKAAIPRLLHYARTTVDASQQQRYTEYANAVTGQPQSYADLYRAHVGSDLMAIQLDQRVVAAALRAGESPEAVAHLLNQGPYARFQQDVKRVAAETIGQYVEGAVAQVQSIQALQLKAEGRGRMKAEGKGQKAEM